MSIKRLVVIGASSGGIEALRVLVAGLPSGFAAPICVVIHTSPEAPGVLDMILDRGGVLRATAAAGGDRLRNGHIYVAPPDFHLLVEPGELRLSKGPKENRFRPAIDPLFRSAAQVYGPGVVGVILSGNLDDGVAGLHIVKQMGGLAVVQDPSDALFPSMPQTALDHVRVDYCVPASDIAALLTQQIATEGEFSPQPLPREVEIELKIAKESNALDAGLEEIGDPSSFACPECQGVLLRLKAAQPLRFRCHTGHAYSADSLLAAVNAASEDGMWTVVRSLEEGRLLLEHLAAHAEQRGDTEGAAALDAQIVRAKRHAEAVRQAAIDLAGVAISNVAAKRHD